MPRKHFNSSSTDIFHTSETSLSHNNAHSRNSASIFSMTMKENSIDSNKKPYPNQSNTSQAIPQDSKLNKSVDYTETKSIPMTKELPFDSISNKENSSFTSNKSQLKQPAFNPYALKNQSNIFNLQDKQERNQQQWNMINSSQRPKEKPVVPFNNKIQYRMRKQQSNKESTADNSCNSCVIQYEVNQIDKCNAIDVKEIQRKFRNKGIDIYHIDYHDSLTFGNQKCLLKVRASESKLNEMNSMISDVERESKVNFSLVTIKGKQNVEPMIPHGASFFISKPSTLFPHKDSRNTSINRSKSVNITNSSKRTIEKKGQSRDTSGRNCRR